jgi:hypothetical protein
VSWQIVPTILFDLLKGYGPRKGGKSDEGHVGDEEAEYQRADEWLKTAAASEIRQRRATASTDAGAGTYIERWTAAGSR